MITEGRRNKKKIIWGEESLFNWKWFEISKKFDKLGNWKEKIVS